MSTVNYKISCLLSQETLNWHYVLYKCNDHQENVFVLEYDMIYQKLISQTGPVALWPGLTVFSPLSFLSSTQSSSPSGQYSSLHHLPMHFHPRHPIIFIPVHSFTVILAIRIIFTPVIILYHAAIFTVRLILHLSTYPCIFFIIFAIRIYPSLSF
jgi:hypothetical protein